MKKIQTKEILLKILISPIELLEKMEDLKRYQSAYMQGGFDYIDFLKNREEKTSLNKRIYALKKNNFIEERKRGKKLFLVLTEKGQKEAIKYKIIHSKETLKNRYCLVIFDIPETERRIRDFFRRFLKDAGFKQLQQSVWISKKNISKELTELIKFNGAEKWIRVITADFISNLK